MSERPRPTWWPLGAGKIIALLVLVAVIALGVSNKFFDAVLVLIAALAVAIVLE